MKNIRILILVILAVFFSNISFAQLSDTELYAACNGFIKSDKLFSDNKILKTKTDIKTIVSNKVLLAYIVELQPEGFVILSPNKNLYPIIGYSEKGNFDFKENEYNTLLTLIKSDIPCQLSSINSKLSDQQKKQVLRNQQKWDNLINETPKTAKAYLYEFGPNLPDIWGGVNCKDENGNYIISATYFTPNNYSPGCVGTSLSQILNMFEWPPVGMKEHTDVDNQGASQGSYYAGFGRMWYDWDNMLDEYHYKPSNDIERRAIGRIAYHCGVAVDMEYENNGSTSNVNRTPTALINYFRSTGHYELGSWNEFWPRLRSNIENGYAVQMAIRDVSSGAGHANVCDGWRQEDASSDKYYHMNNGWWGTCNAWYRLQVSFNDCGYDAIDGAVFDILPNPMFEDEVDWADTDTKTFTIKWNVSKYLNWEAFELQEDKDNSGTWTTISNNITDTFYTRTVSAEGVYKYQVRAKSSGAYYNNSYSEILRVPVEKIVYLNFDGDDSYYLKDNPINQLDSMKDNWTIETWVEVDNRPAGTYPIIFDRKTVFSMYLIDDADAGSDYGIRFVARDVNGNIIASVQSDINSDLSYNEWVHVAVSRDGSTTKMFINGEEVDASTDADFVLSATTNALNIGARYWTTYERYLDGRIDEIRISDTARYTSNFCPDRFYRFTTDKNTITLMHIDAFIGSTIKDYSYNFINPTLRAAANDPGWASSTCPIILQEPEDMALCNGSVDFSVTAVQVSTYQWFENTGAGYTALTDGGVYSGTTTNKLTISDVSGLDGNKYRCIVTGNSSYITKDCSREATLTVYPVCTIWNGSSWSNGEPTLSMSALIAGDYTLPNDILAKDLTIQSPYTVIVPPNLTLTVKDYFEHHGNLILQSNTDQIPTGALTLYGIQNNFGIFTAQRYISVPSPGTWGNWHLFAFPFESNPMLSDIFTGTYYIYENLETTYSWNLLSSSDIIPSKNGLLVQLMNSGQTIQYSGEFGNGVYNNTLELTNGTNLGWHLMKNPYPSPIDWNSASGWTRNNTSSTVYTFDTENNGGSNQYSAWDGTVGTYSGSRYINSFQSFFVQALSDGAIFNFNNDIRVKNSDVAGNYLKDNNSISDILKLSVTAPNNKKDQIVVYAGNTESESRNILPLDSDAPDLFIPGIYQNNTIKRILNSENEIIIPINVNSSLSGEFMFETLYLNEKEFRIYLIDNFNNKTYKLTNSFTLDFINSDKTDERFSILFTKNTSLIKDLSSVNCFINVLNKTINVHNEQNAVSLYKLFTIDGKCLFTISSKDKKVSFKDLNAGIYIVKIITNNKIITKKAVVN